MRGLGALPGVITLAVCAACGDPPICPSEVFVALQTSQIASDVDGDAAGVQADVTVKTSAAAGERVQLEVVDASGAVTATLEAPIDARGLAEFRAVSVAPPQTTLRASVDTPCGAASDERTVDVFAGVAGCELALVPTPRPSPHYAPLEVLAMATDLDPATPGHQTTAVVTTRPGRTVELVESTADGDVVRATGFAAADGTARFAHTLADGLRILRATCRDTSGAGAAALPVAVIVDTTPPACSFTHPRAGSTITPRFDANTDLADGVQLAATAAVVGADVEGEPTTLIVTPIGGPSQMAAASAVDATGAMSAAITLAPATTPASFELALGARDHAGNACTTVETFEVSYDACDLAIVTPTATVTRDANNVAGDGSQLDVTLAVSPACVGRTITSTCGSDSPSGVVPASGALTLRPTICASSPCEATAACSFRVATAAGLITRTAAVLGFDDQAPITTVSIVEPAVVCGVQLTAASDTDPAAAGVQLVARVDAPTAVRRLLDIASAAGTTALEVDGDQDVTLAPGVNRLVGTAFDAAGNRGRSGPCIITLAE